MKMRFWQWLFLKSLYKISSGWGACSNRRWHIANVKTLEISIVTRDTNEPNGYSREELYQALAVIRYHERRQGWKCPEPDQDTINRHTYFPESM